MFTAAPTFLTLSRCALVLEILVVVVACVRARHVEAVPAHPSLDLESLSTTHKPVRLVVIVPERVAHSESEAYVRN